MGETGAHRLTADYVGDLVGPYNLCPTCGFVATQIKYCPFDGEELEHVAAERLCPFCQGVVWFKDATYCGTCGGWLDSWVDVPA